MGAPTLADLPAPPPGKTGWPWTQEAPQLPLLRADGTPWPRIAIVTPSYNQATYIEATLRSVLLQGYPDLEYIVIDGGSTDGTADIIRKYAPWLTYWVSEPDRGQAHAINKGFEVASGDLLNWLNSDDILLPNALRTIAHIATLVPDAGIIAGSRLQDALDGQLASAETPTIDAWPYYLVGMPHFPQDSSFFSRQVWNAAKPVDEHLTYLLDVAFYMRAAEAARSIALTKMLFSKMSVYPGMKTLRSDPERKAQERQYLETRYRPASAGKRLAVRLLRTRMYKFLVVGLCYLLKSQTRIWIVDYAPETDSWIATRP